MALVVLAGSAWWVNGWLADGSPVVDAFYDAPAVAPDEPGVLIRADEYLGQAPSGGRVQRILYSTTDAVGVRAIASALVISPIDPPPGPRPVISWNWGTTGVTRGCAPSLMTSTATRWAIPAVDQALERGWVVVASDYSGRGADGRFPYLIGEGEARSSIDAIRAARQLDGTAPVLRHRRVGALAGRARGPVDRAGRRRLRAGDEDPGNRGAVAAHRSALDGT